MDNIFIDLSQIKAVIFDMDGTMINNMPYHKKAWMEFFTRHGLSFSGEEFRQKISGKKNNQIFEIVFGKKLSSDEIKKYTDEKEEIYRKLYAPEIKEISGLSRMIQLFREKGLKLAIATTAPEKNRTFGLQSLGLENAFDVILGDEHVTKGKPDPEIYLQTAKLLHVSPRECLVFEDTPPGVEAAKRAGMTVVGILSSHSKEELHKANYIIENYTQITLRNMENLNRDKKMIQSLLQSGKFQLVSNKVSNTSLLDMIVRQLEKLYKGQPVIVVLTAGPGAGKAVLLSKIVKRLEQKDHKSDVVSTDDFCLYTREERNRLIKERKISVLEGKGFDYLNKLVEKIKQKESVKAPVYNELTGDAMVIGEENFPHHIIENLHFFFVEGDFQPVENPDYKIYFHVPTDVRRENRIVRDVEKRSGGDPEKVKQSFDYRLESQYYPYTLPQAEKADMLIIVSAEKVSGREYPYTYTYDMYERNHNNR